MTVYLKCAFFLFGLIIMAGCTSADRAIAKPTLTSPTQMTDAPDPAVIFANASSSDDIKYKEGYFGAGDSRLHYVEAGKGPLIIFYHGFPSFWYSWFDQMEALKGSYRVVAVDGLGSGLSAKPLQLEPYEITNLTAQLDLFARHIGGDEKYILIGHDWGSVLALSYAQAYPHRLHKVVGMSAPPLNLILKYAAENQEQRRRAQYMQRFRETTLEMLKSVNRIETARVRSYGNLAKRGDISQQEFELFKNALSSNEMLYAAMNWYRANVPSFEKVTDEDLWPAPDAKITMPALFIWGDQDRIFVPELINSIDDHGTDMRTIKLKGLNHWISMEQPERATKAIVDFLKE